MSKVVVDYEVFHHGITNGQYFPGFSASRDSSFDESATGVGDNPHEALEDALEQLANSGWNVDSVVNDEPETPSAMEEERIDAINNADACPECDATGEVSGEECENCDGQGVLIPEDDGDGEGLSYFLSISVKGIDQEFVDAVVYVLDTYQISHYKVEFVATDGEPKVQVVMGTQEEAEEVEQAIADSRLLNKEMVEVLYEEE